MPILILMPHASYLMLHLAPHASLCLMLHALGDQWGDCGHRWRLHRLPPRPGEGEPAEPKDKDVHWPLIGQEL